MQNVQKYDPNEMSLPDSMPMATRDHPDRVLLSVVILHVFDYFWLGGGLLQKIGRLDLAR